MAFLNAERRLSSIDWDFPNAGNKPGSVHMLHWFPGNFIPQIPAALIQILSRPGDLVLDPFCGSGTTAVEALRLRRRAVASDRLSACVMITSAKLALLGGDLQAGRRGALLASLAFEGQCRSDQSGRNGEGSNPELAGWFAPDTMAQLRFLWRLVEEEPTRGAREILAALFSDVLFDCAAAGPSGARPGPKRRHHWGWIADNVRPRELATHNAIRLFHHRLAALDVGEGGGSAGQPRNAWTVRQNATALALADQSVDLVVTSPPYVGVIDYTHANRLLYLWINWSMREEREEEIGARFRRTRRDAVSEYLAAIRTASGEIFRVLKPGAACAIVVGESRRFPGAALMALLEFERLMPKIWGPVPRLSSRRRVSDRAASEAVEYVCVFQRP